MMGTPGKDDKSVIQKKQTFISTMMALFPLVGLKVNKKNKQTQKNLSFIVVYHKFS